MNTSLNQNSLIGKISGSSSLSAKLESSALSSNLSIGSNNTYLDYSGSYDIIPTENDQTLQTKNKILRDNLLVERIPYYETSNEYGKTIYIGDEVEINGD